MATHITSIKNSTIPRVTKEQFYGELRGGDLVFCQGNYAISKGIEVITGSPFSHVFMSWLPEGADQWLTMESTSDKGVHIGRLTDYLDSYDGDVVIGRLTGFGLTDTIQALNAGFKVLEEAYDFAQEGSIVARKLCSKLPLIKPTKEYYCSGLMWLITQATKFPLQQTGANLPTPEDNWTDPKVVPVCAYVKS